MHDTVYVPHERYRALRFGMTRAEANALLGEPTRTDRAVDGPVIFPEHVPLMRNVVYHDYQPYRPYHAEPVSLTFDEDRLVEIFLNDSVDPLPFEDLDLFGRDRKGISQALFDREEEPYGNREKGFFPSLGLVVPWPHFWKQYKGGYVIMVDSQFVLDRLDFYSLDPIDAPLK